MGLLASPIANDLLQSVRRFLGEPDAANSKWSDQDLMNFLNEGVRKYFCEVIQGQEGQFQTQVSLDVVAGVETVSLPSDFFEVVDLYMKNGDYWMPVKYNNARAQGYSTQGPMTSQGFLDYRFRGNQLVFKPTPQFTETGVFLLDYIQFPTTMITGGDSLTNQVSPIFKDLIEMYAVYKAKLWESLRGNSVDLDSKISGHLGDLYRQFKQVIENRSQYPTYTRPFNPED